MNASRKVQMIMDHLKALPDGATRTSRALCVDLNLPAYVSHHVGCDPLLAPYRTGGGKGTDVVWHNGGHGKKVVVEKHPEVGAVISPVTPVVVKTQEDVDRDDLSNSTIRRLQSDNKRLRIALADKREVIKVIAGAVTPINVTPYVKHTPKVKNPATLGLVLSDLHIGEVVDPVQMGGVNAYNFELASDGLRDIVDRVIRWADVMSPAYDIQDVVVWVLGDVVTGNIHESAFNEFPSPVASAKAGLLLAEVYGTLSERFRVRVIQVAGNHDRMTQAQPFKHVTQQSMAYPAFVIASEAVRNYDGHVDVETPDDTIPVIEAHPGIWIAAMHGHQIKSTGVSPYYGIARRTNAMLRERSDRGLPRLNTVLLGHFHNFAVLESGQTILCPSLMGPTEWSRQLGFQGTPAQLAFLIGDRGLFALTPFERRMEV